MTTNQPTRLDVEAARGEIFHMILFAMAWVMIGEYALDFKDYAAAAVLVIVAVVILALHSIRLYTLEDRLPDAEVGVDPLERKQKRRTRLYALLLIAEGIAIMITWMVVVHLGRRDWLVPGFALVAGLHFFPLARVIRLNSYYLLGAWICVLAVAVYVLEVTGYLPDEGGSALIAYGCAAGAIVDGAWIVARSMQKIH
ncbi:DUF7010 family protein [Dinghuibacter silviterrae]|uniref:Uncharacterized protein n=1 Tax=Dinghuibacter silviterrae TaxID=1539049 RepID=A0A4R8DGU1_9BACT|nr:hypothetical protein [Dinghuibacter silviterrae]TDW96687.1 hypothetical protein EDB95_4523 [Dinghuibacter silviterrae]